MMRMKQKQIPLVNPRSQGRVRNLYQRSQGGIALSLSPNQRLIKKLKEMCMGVIILYGLPSDELPNQLKEKVETEEEVIFETEEKIIFGYDYFNNRTLNYIMETAKELGWDRPYEIALQTIFKLDKMIAEIKSFDENLDFEEAFSGIKYLFAQHTSWKRFSLKSWKTEIDLDLGDHEGQFMFECKDYVLKRVVHGYSGEEEFDKPVWDRLHNRASVEMYVEGKVVKADSFVFDVNFDWDSNNEES